MCVWCMHGGCVGWMVCVCVEEYVQGVGLLCSVYVCGLYRDTGDVCGVYMGEGVCICGLYIVMGGVWYIVCVGLGCKCGVCMECCMHVYVCVGCLYMCVSMHMCEWCVWYVV